MGAAHARSHTQRNGGSMVKNLDWLIDKLWRVADYTEFEGRAEDPALKDVTVIVTADNKVGLYDNQGKVLK